MTAFLILPAILAICAIGLCGDVIWRSRRAVQDQAAKTASGSGGGGGPKEPA